MQVNGLSISKKPDQDRKCYFVPPQIRPDEPCRFHNVIVHCSGAYAELPGNFIVTFTIDLAKLKNLLALRWELIDSRIQKPLVFCMLDLIFRINVKLIGSGHN